VFDRGPSRKTRGLEKKKRKKKSLKKGKIAFRGKGPGGGTPSGQYLALLPSWGWEGPGPFRRRTRGKGKGGARTQRGDYDSAWGLKAPPVPGGGVGLSGLCRGTRDRRGCVWAFGKKGAGELGPGQNSHGKLGRRGGRQPLPGRMRGLLTFAGQKRGEKGPFEACGEG